MFLMLVWGWLVIAAAEPAVSCHFYGGGELDGKVAHGYSLEGEP